MNKDVASQPKEKLDSTAVIESRWVTIRKEHYLSNGGGTLEYWVADRSDSAIILVRQSDKFVLGDAQIRPGIEQKTLDFPGGRIGDADALAAAKTCVRREFQLGNTVFPDPIPITKPLFVDSAFSNQKVHGFLLEMPKDIKLEGAHYTADQLIEQLQCLQCRAILLEWMRAQR